MLGEGERRLLSLLIAAHPESVARVELAERGGYPGPLARIITLDFAEMVKSGIVRVGSLLFLKGKERSR